MSLIGINIGGREIFLKINLFEDKDEIDIDKILKIDAQNLTAEILTFPSILNKLGVLLADKDNDKKQAELNYRIWKAKQQELIRNKWDNDPEKKINRGQKYTKDEVEDSIVSSPMFKVQKTKIHRLEKEHSYLNSIYWAAKDKADKLEKLSLTLKSEDIDIENIVKSFNGIMIKSSKPLIE